MAVVCHDVPCLTPGTCGFSGQCVNGAPEPPPVVGFRCTKCGVSRPGQQVGKPVPKRCSDRFCQGALEPIVREENQD